MTGAASLMQDQPNYYTYLCELPRNPENKGIKQISKDLTRTFPGDKSLNKMSLKNILECYSLRNPNIGYCQGLNFIAATILSLGFSEIESFWLFVQILENYTPTHYYNSMSGVILDQKVFDNIFVHKLPKLANALEVLGIESCLFTVQWFICMFSFNFDKDVVCAMWDIIFLHGHASSFNIGIAVLSLIKDEILPQRDFITALATIEQECRKITVGQFKAAMKDKLFRVPYNTITKLRANLESGVMADYNSRFNRVYSQDELLGSIGKVCVDDGECKQKILKTSAFFTFGNQLEEIDGYLDLYTYPKYINYPDFFHDKHLMGKKNHCCKHEEGVEEEIKLEEVIEEPLEFIKKSSFIGSFRRSLLASSESLSDF